MTKSLLILVDEPNWVFDRWAKEISRFLIKNDVCVSCCYRHTIPDRIMHDIIIVCWWEDVLFLRNRVTERQTILCRICDMVTWNSNASLEYQQKFNNILTYVDLFLLSSKQIAKKFWQDFHLTDFLVVGDCVNVDDFVFVERDFSEELVFGWCGNPKALKWMGIIDIKGFRFIKELQRRGLHINIASNLPLEQMPKWYSKIDVWICASQSEGTPMPLLEAMSSGNIVISRPVGVVPEMHSNGVHVIENSIDSFMDAVKTIEMNPEIAYHESITNRQEIEKKWSVEITGLEYLKILNSLA